MLKALAVVAAVGLTVYCLFDIRGSARQRVRVLPRTAWFVVVLVPLVGPLAWLFAGRPRSGPAGRSVPPRIVGPDDDPDFLWEIERRRRRRRPGDGDDNPQPHAG